MRLLTYLRSTDTTRAAFARAVGVSPATVTRWCDGSRRPDPRQLRAIMRVTRGRVGPDDFYDLACSPRDWRCHVRAYAARNGLAMADIAMQIGVTDTTLSKWMMRAGRGPSLDSALRLVRLDPKNIKLEHFIDADRNAEPDRRTSRKTARSIRPAA